ncbi:MAG: hypothetical protein WA609_10450 [Terriglobales bacterium]
MAVAVLLVVIAVLLHTCHRRRDYTLSVALLIATSTWLAIEIHALRLVRAVLAVALEHWVDTVVAFSGVILLIVPALMLYIAIRDQIDNRAVADAGYHSHGHVRNTVLNTFERRVATLMALGYGRTQAEATALQQMKRDLDHHAVGRQESKHHS